MNGVMVTNRNIVCVVGELQVPEEPLFNLCNSGTVGTGGVRLHLGRTRRVKHDYIDSTYAEGGLLRHPRA